MSTTENYTLATHSGLAYPTRVGENIVLSNNIETQILNIYNNILGEKEICDKIGIIAPPGTKFLLSDNDQNPKLISVGATGLYELEGIKLTEIKVIPITQYTYDPKKTAEYLQAGKNGLIEALNNFYTTLTNNNITGSNEDQVSQQNLDNIHADLLNFEELYTNNYTTYQIGLNGVYESSDTNFLPQTGIIIDYRVEEVTNE